MSRADRKRRTSGIAAHHRATPTRRPAPKAPPNCPTKFGPVRCPTCESHWTGLGWGCACPDCGTVRMKDGNWFPWGDSE
jgi:hypothetical protein